MSLLVVQHSPTDRPGLVTEMPFSIKVHRADLDPVLPPLGDAQGLILMGGPQAAYSDENFPSRKGELRLIREALAARVPVLGICLGAQLLAVAGGGRGYRREQAEIGWLPVTLTSDGAEDLLFQDCDTTFIPRHHHYDTFAMPEGAVRLASSKDCIEQGFRLGPNAWGLQFHFEMQSRTTNPSVGPELQDGVRVLADETPEDDEHTIESLQLLAPTARRIFANFTTAIHNAVHTSSVFS